jgi:hypothetical protein
LTLISPPRGESLIDFELAGSGIAARSFLESAAATARASNA